MRILVILASGIGNSILFGPTLRALQFGLPDVIVDLYVYKKEFGDPFRGGNCYRDIITQEGLITIFKLRNRDYDVSITSFPSNRWQFNLFAWLVGANRRITHQYDVGQWKTLSFLQNEKIPADDTLHDVEQNLNLLSPLGINRPEDPELWFHLDEKHREFAREFLREHDFSDRHRIGLHPGAGPLEWKRAPEQEFIDETRNRRENDSAVLIFGGPDERSLKKQFRKRIENQLNLPALPISGSLKQTAALVETCHHFITNDTALSHIATAVEVPDLLVFFCGTNPTRTRPWTERAEVKILEDCTYNYPFRRTTPDAG